MKKLFLILFFANLCFGIEVTDITSNFDSGNLTNIVKVSDNNFTAAVSAVYDTDPTNEYIWYYFRVDNCANTTFKINITNITASYKNCYYLYSYDGNNWSWSSTKLSTTTLTHNPGTNNTVYIATDHPYTYTAMDANVSSLSSLSCVTLAYHTMASGRKVYTVKVTDSNVADSLKKKVVVMTGQHSGERVGMIVARGLLGVLTSDDPNAQLLRKKCVFTMFPMMNVNGVYAGGGRRNANSIDLNREWADSNANTEAEVLYARDIIKTGVNYFVDFHTNGPATTFLKRADCGSGVEANSILWINAIKATTFWNGTSATTSSTAGVSTWYCASQGASAVTADFDTSVSTTGAELTWAQAEAQGVIFAENMLSYIHVAPVLDFISDKTVNEGNSLTFDVNGSDLDGNTLTYSLPICPNDAVLDGIHFSWTPDYNQAGNRLIRVQVSDGEYTDMQDVNIIVGDTPPSSNHIPVLDFIGNKDVNEGSVLSFDVNATDADVCDVLTYTCTYNNGALPSGAILSDIHFTWTPESDQVGNYNFKFQVSDGNAIDTEIIMITVNSNIVNISSVKKNNVDFSEW